MLMQRLGTTDIETLLLSGQNRWGIDLPCHLLGDFAIAIIHGETMRLGPTTVTRAALLLQKVFPSKQTLSKIYPVTADSWRAYAYYPVNWWRLSSDRLPKILKSGHIDYQLEIERVRRIRSWLRNGN